MPPYLPQHALDNLSKFKLAPDCDLNRVINDIPFNFTGADFYALCSNGLASAIRRYVFIGRYCSLLSIFKAVEVDYLTVSFFRRRAEELETYIQRVNCEREVAAKATNDTHVQPAVKLLNPRTLLGNMSADELHVQVKEEDFLQALVSIVPSVSTDEIAHYEELRQQFSAKQAD
jgi:peroxin-6